MELTLKNFKVWNDKTFILNKKDDITLISGKSGKGKTSILQAIYFVLYGIGGSKIISHGKKSCSVKMKWSELTITRTKGPNRLVLLMNNKQYEDASAQEIIKTTFGRNFNIISYISQKGAKSFLNLSPKDKLLFLEEICFDEMLSEMKLKTVKNVKTEKENMIRIQSELKSTKMFLDDLDEVEERPKLPYTEDYKKKKVKLQGDVKHLEYKLKEAINEKMKVIKEINRNVMLQDKVIEYEEEMEGILIKNDDELKKELSIINNIIKHLSLKDKSISLKRNLDRYREVEKVRESERVAKIEKKIEEVSKLVMSSEEKKELLNSRKKLIEDVNVIRQIERISSIKTLSSDITKAEEEYKKYSEKKDKYMNGIKDIEKKLFNMTKRLCPCCNKVLFIENDVLKIHENQEPFELEDNKDSKKYEKEISMNKKKISLCDRKIRELNIKISELKKCQALDYDIDAENKLNVVRKKLTSGVKQSVLDSLKESMKTKENKHIKTMENEIKEIKYDKDIIMDKDIIKVDKERKILELKINTILESKERKEKLREKIKDTLSQITEREEWDDDILTEISNKIDNKKKDIGKVNSIIEEIKEYQRWEQEYKFYKKWESKLNDISLELKRVEVKYTALLKLKNIILKAESITLINYINSINIYLEKYLNIFFYEDPIVIHLSPFKESKKGKVRHQINIKVIYKGIETDLNCLSGGEYDRVQLAINLALSDLHTTPLLLLDESISSLDEVTCSKVLRGIKSKQRMTIVVAHQVVKGNFDNVINL